MTIAIVGVLAAQDGVLWSTGTHTLRGTAPGCAFFLRESEGGHRVARAAWTPNFFLSDTPGTDWTAASSCAGLADHIPKPPAASGRRYSPSPSFGRASAPAAARVRNRPLQALHSRLVSSPCRLAALPGGVHSVLQPTESRSPPFGLFDGTSLAPRGRPDRSACHVRGMSQSRPLPKVSRRAHHICQNLVRSGIWCGYEGRRVARAVASL